MTQRSMGDRPSRPIREGDHASIFAVLPEYVTMLALDQRPPPEWHPLEQHLRSCPDCRSEAEALRRLMDETYSGALPAHAAAPPDLAFLRRPTPEARPAPAAGAQAQRPPAAPWSVTIQFSAAILPRMRVPMAARQRGRRLRYHYERPSTDGREPVITVEVFEADATPDRGPVRVCVEPVEGNPFEQGGDQVTLQVPGGRWTRRTDHQGVALFPDVPLDQIEQWQVTVTPASPE